RAGVGGERPRRARRARSRGRVAGGRAERRGGARADGACGGGGPRARGGGGGVGASRARGARGRAGPGPRRRLPQRRGGARRRRRRRGPRGRGGVRRGGDRLGRGTRGARAADRVHGRGPGGGGAVILEAILAHKRAEIAARRAAVPEAALRARPTWAEPRRGFRAALARAPVPVVIAECKRASPSRGLIRVDYDPAAHALSYARGGAAALSVLTDERFFQGSLEHLAAVRAACTLPCLRKDFLVDPYQVAEARAWGADAVLLIAAGCPPALGAKLLAAAAALELDVLVEVHDEAELAWALEAGTTLVGINNRDLRTFRTTL